MLLKTFQQFGEIVREQFMWHKSGELRGTPRGFAFIEFRTREEAKKAQAGANNVVLLGRKLTVRYAEERETEPAGDASIATASLEQRRNDDMNKSSMVSIGTKDKIRAIEEKLRMMQETKKEKILTPSRAMKRR